MDYEQLKRMEPLFGSWYIDREIGKGTFGNVYRIYKDDAGVRFWAALKIITILPDNTGDTRGMDQRSAIDAIAAEIRIMNTLRGYSNIVCFEDHQTIMHADGVGRDILIRMELLERLDDYMKRIRATQYDVLCMLRDITQALVLCDKKNIIHRDIKPDNIMVSDGGDYKLVDFGIARNMERATIIATKAGTYPYMAPEVQMHQPYGKTVDIYSLGIVAYREFNAYRYPFLPPYPNEYTAEDRDQALFRRFSGEKLPPIPGLNKQLFAIIEKCAAHKPDHRYASASELLSDLEALMGNGEFKQKKLYDEAGNLIPTGTGAKKDRKMGKGIAIALTSIVLAGAGGFLAWKLLGEPEILPFLKKDASGGVTREAEIPVITDAPALPPSDEPTMAQTEVPTPDPTEAPTPDPTDAPATEIADTPVIEPTASPVLKPTDPPTPEPIPEQIDEDTAEALPMFWFLELHQASTQHIQAQMDGKPVESQVWLRREDRPGGNEALPEKGFYIVVPEEASLGLHSLRVTATDLNGNETPDSVETVFALKEENGVRSFELGDQPSALRVETADGRRVYGQNDGWLTLNISGMPGLTARVQCGQNFWTVDLGTEGSGAVSIRINSLPLNEQTDISVCYEYFGQGSESATNVPVLVDALCAVQIDQQQSGKTEIAGTAEADAEVYLEINGKATGSVKTQEDGSFRFTGLRLRPADQVMLYGVDAFGNYSDQVRYVMNLDYPPITAGLSGLNENGLLTGSVSSVRISGTALEDAMVQVSLATEEGESLYEGSILSEGGMWATNSSVELRRLTGSGKLLLTAAYEEEGKESLSAKVWIDYDRSCDLVFPDYSQTGLTEDESMISGRSDEGARVTLLNDRLEVIAEDTADSTGAFLLHVAGKLKEGDTLTAQAQDPCGNEAIYASFPTVTRGVLADITLEIQPQLTAGTDGALYLTKELSSLRLYGSARKNAELTVRQNGRSVGSAAANDEGAWDFSLALDELAENQKTELQIVYAQWPDEKSAEISFVKKTRFTVTIEGTPSVGDNSVTVVTEAGNRVSIYMNNTFAGSGIAQTDGELTVKTSLLTPNAVLRVEAVSPAGISDSQEVTVIDPAQIARENAMTIFCKEAREGIVNGAASELTFSGQAKAGRKVGVTLYMDGSDELIVLSAAVDDAGVWTCEPVDLGNFADEQIITAVAKYEDEEGYRVKCTVLVDTACDPIMLDAECRQLTEETRQISGTTEKNAALTLFVNEERYEAAAGADGRFVLPVRALRPGDSLYLEAVDAAGNRTAYPAEGVWRMEKESRGAITLQLDSTVNGSGYLLDKETLNLSGSAQADQPLKLMINGKAAWSGFRAEGSGKDGAYALNFDLSPYRTADTVTLRLQVLYEDEEGEGSPVVSVKLDSECAAFTELERINEESAVIRGKTEKGATVRLLLPDGSAAAVKVADSEGNFELALPNDLTAGAQLKLQARDTAGNTAETDVTVEEAQRSQIIIQTDQMVQKPMNPSVYLGKAGDTLSLRGTASDGKKVRVRLIYSNGITVPLNEKIVSAENGQWAVELKLPATLDTITASVEYADGRFSEWSASLDIEVDGECKLRFDALPEDGDQEIRVTSEIGATVRLIINGKEVKQAQLKNSASNWFTGLSLREGDQVEVEGEDLVGNRNTISCQVSSRTPTVQDVSERDGYIYVVGVASPERELVLSVNGEAAYPVESDEYGNWVAYFPAQEAPEGNKEYTIQYAEDAEPLREQEKESGETENNQPITSSVQGKKADAAPTITPTATPKASAAQKPTAAPTQKPAAKATEKPTAAPALTAIQINTDALIKKPMKDIYLIKGTAEKLLLQGTATAGSKVRFVIRCQDKDKTKNQKEQLTSAVTVGSQGKWSCQVPVPADWNSMLFIVQYVSDESQALSAQVLTEKDMSCVLNVPEIDEADTQLTVYSEPSATVTLLINGKVHSEKKLTLSGETFNGLQLKAGDKVTVNARDLVGNEASVSFTIKKVEQTEIKVDAPFESSGYVYFSGSASASRSLILKVGANEYPFKADAKGNWTLSISTANLGSGQINYSVRYENQQESPNDPGGTFTIRSK